MGSHQLYYSIYNMFSPSYASERAPRRTGRDMRGIRGDAAPLRATPHANNNATPIFAALIPTYSPLISRLC